MGLQLSPFFEDFMMYAMPPGTTLTLTPEQVEEMERNTKVIINDATLSHLCWVDVKDRLPSDGHEVLVYCDVCGIDISRFNVSDKSWSNHEEQDIESEVTHWMPLPEPPTKE